jgi:predicted phosphoribosyltransferase
MHFRFNDRKDAGSRLAEELKPYANRADVVVLALPRGGVPVASEVAKSLKAPLDVFLVRKLGVPGQVELAMGAISSGGVRVLNDEVITVLGIPPSVIDQVAIREQAELERREKLYRGVRPLPDLQSKTVILVDDGLATGSSMRAAVEALKRHHPARIVVAVPVAPLSTFLSFSDAIAEIVAVKTPSEFGGVGSWYLDFTQTTDDEVSEILTDAWGRIERERAAAGSPRSDR